MIPTKYLQAIYLREKGDFLQSFMADKALKAFNEKTLLTRGHEILETDGYPIYLELFYDFTFPLEEVK